jgi:hypothetical protein
VDAFYGAATYLNNEGHTACSISADTVPDQHMNLERVWIKCGDKTILITRATIGANKYHSVDEHLGALKPDSQ